MFIYLFNFFYFNYPISFFIYNIIKMIESLQQKIFKELEKSQEHIVFLNNSNFENGFYIITQPGTYILTEHIVFNPNFKWLKENHFLLFPTTQQYKEPPYNNQSTQLGFFSAIVIQSSHVIIDLNGYSISQSKLHYLQQRFFNIINLNSSMFIHTQGPINGSLSNPIKDIDSQYIHIKNGSFGLTSHYGIFGNNNSHIIIENCEFTNFEVGGISLNNCDHSIFKNINIHHNHIHIPVTSNYSLLINTLITLQKCDPSLLHDIQINDTNAKHVLQNLYRLHCRIIKNYIINEYKQIRSNTQHDIYEDEIEKLYHNSSGFSDGSTIVGIQITPKGVAIGDFTSNPCKHMKNNKDCKMNQEYCHDIYMDTIDINHIHTNINQTITMNYKDKPLSGCVGDAIPLNCLVNEQGYYHKYILYQNLFCLAKLIQKENQNIVTSNYLPDFLIRWCDDLNLSLYELEEYKYISYNYNTDIMLHVNKGCIALRLGGIRHLFLQKINIHSITNQGIIIDKDKFNSHTYSGNKAYGITFSYCKDIQINHGLHIKDISSTYNHSYDILIQE